MEGANSFTDIVLHCIRNESEDYQPNATVEEFVSNKKEKELFTVTKETKEQDEDFSDDKPTKSFEGWDWRDKSCAGRNKDKEISKCVYSVRSNSSSSSDQCNWRIKKDTEQEQTPSEKERKERCERSDTSDMNSPEGWNWRNKNGSGSLYNRNKDQEVVRSICSRRSSSSTSSDQCNWRNRKDTEQEQTPSEKERKERCERSDTSNMNSPEGWNWRNKNGSAEYEMPRSSRNSNRSVLSEEALRMKGYWCFKCDSKRISPDGLSEADMVWSVLKDLYKENQELIQFPPSINHFSKGYSLLRCYTPDNRDIESILKVAVIIRERIDFPYLIDYYRCNYNNKCIYIYTHAGELYKKIEKEWKLCS